MQELINKMTDNAKKTWSKVRESFNMDNTDEDYLQWKEETLGIIKEEGEEGFFDLCQMEGLDTYDMETLLYYAFKN